MNLLVQGNEYKLRTIVCAFGKRDPVTMWTYLLCFGPIHHHHPTGINRFLIGLNAMARRIIFSLSRCGERTGREKRSRKRGKRSSALPLHGQAFLSASKRPLSQVDCTITHAPRITSTIQWTDFQLSHRAYLLFPYKKPMFVNTDYRLY